MDDFVEQSAAAADTALPPTVWVPCSPGEPGDDGASLDLRETPDGRLALLVYSAPDRLVACCGPHQPWITLQTSDLEQIRAETGFSVALLDVELPKELWRS